VGVAVGPLVDLGGSSGGEFSLAISAACFRWNVALGRVTDERFAPGGNATIRADVHDAVEALARDAGCSRTEGDAMTTLAAIHLQLDKPQAALDHASRGIDVHSEIGHRLGPHAPTSSLLEPPAGRTHRGRSQPSAAGRNLSAEVGAPLPDYRHG
jgi:hypothetical protein